MSKNVDEEIFWERKCGTSRAPFYVEVKNEGCEQCGSNRTWSIVGPDDVSLYTTYESADEAEDLAEDLTDAYIMGYEAGKRGSKDE